MPLTKVTQHSLGNSAVTSAKLNLTTLSAGNTTITGTANVTGAATFSNTVAIGSDYISPYAGFKNRIINGAMVIDQRNAGASVTPTDQSYSLDRWKMYVSQASKYTAQQSTTVPVGFSNSLLITSSSAYTVGASERFMFGQGIEGYNVADLQWGTANAKTITISFWVRSSLTGTFGGSLGNVDSTRTYPFSYTISSSNTWTQISITVAGDTSGTWNSTTGGGLWIYIGLGVGSTYSGTAGAWAGATYFSATGATSVVGTSGATFYITGVQLEKGSTATSFDYRPYGTELALCQRYYEKSYLQGTVPGTATDAGRIINVFGTTSSAYAGGFVSYKITKRTAATPTVYAPSNGSSGNINGYNFGIATNVVTPTIDNPIDTGFGFYFTGTTVNGWGVHYAVSAEL